MRVHFAKYVACGNDFILFDNRDRTFPLTSKKLITNLCHRQYGIGADGILLLEPSEKGHCCMRIFNSDGSEAEMCGNGLRCFTHWLIHLGIETQPFDIEVMGKIYRTSQTIDTISVELGDPCEVQWNIDCTYNNAILTLHHLNTGVPHVILFEEEIDRIDLLKLGRHFRYHPKWGPEGTNVTLAQRVAKQKIYIRTYERGVEGETLACGTGATAAAIAAAHQFCISSPVTVRTRSGEEVVITFEDPFRQVILHGKASHVFSGEVELTY